MTQLVFDVENAAALKVAIRVKHLLDVGWTINVYAHHCDLTFSTSFAKCSFSGAFPDALYSEQINKCEYLRLAEVTRCARELAEETRIAEQNFETERQVELEKLNRLALVRDIASDVNELLQLLAKVRLDSKWQDGIADFWRVHTPAAGDEPLIQFAPQWWKESYWVNVRYAPLSIEKQLKVLSQPSLQLSQAVRKVIPPISTVARSRTVTQPWLIAALG